MKVQFKDNNAFIKDIKNFDLLKTIKSGQSFRYYEVDEGIVVINRNIANYMYQDPLNNTLVIENCSKSKCDEWIKYFNLDEDYEKINQRILSLDKSYKDMIEFGKGVRIQKIDEYEAMITFIISANNNMKRIKKSIDDLARKYGKRIDEIKNIECYELPSPEVMVALSIENIRDCGVGFRDNYLYDMANRIVKGEICIKKMRLMDAIEVKNELMKIKGIGDKVANCIRLFAFNKFEAFPVDVWIERYMIENVLPKEKLYSKIEIEKYAMDKYGDIAGYVQQYMFYYCIYQIKNIKI